MLEAIRIEWEMIRLLFHSHWAGGGITKGGYYSRPLIVFVWPFLFALMKCMIDFQRQWFFNWVFCKSSYLDSLFPEYLLDYLPKFFYCATLKYKFDLAFYVKGHCCASMQLSIPDCPFSQPRVCSKWLKPLSPWWVCGVDQQYHNLSILISCLGLL